MINILFITDYDTHKERDTIFPLINNISSYSDVSVYIFSRSFGKGFLSKGKNSISVNKVDSGFFYENLDSFKLHKYSIDISCLDAVILRLDHPVEDRYLDEIKEIFRGKVIINNPEGIKNTYRKDYLLRYEKFIPNIKILSCYGDIIKESRERNIVLKSLRSYGGMGVSKIISGVVYTGDKTFDVENKKLFDKYFNEDSYMSMDYMENVSKGDKRIAVFNGNILGSFNRLPAEGSWLCNLTSGGSISPSVVEEEEINMVATINKDMDDNGIYLYGIDTLEGNNGRRVLSEINTLNVGGISIIDKLYGLNNIDFVSKGILEIIS